MPNRVLAFVRRLVASQAVAPEPPPVKKDFPGAFVYFMDEDEQTVLYRKPWPHLGMPFDDDYAVTPGMWLIGKQWFGASRRDADGNWIFRRCAK